jgi:hypothetical protein
MAINYERGPIHLMELLNDVLTDPEDDEKSDLERLKVAALIGIYGEIFEIRKRLENK